MNSPVVIPGTKPLARPAGSGRSRANAFSWLPLMNIPTREPTHNRGVIRGWRALLIGTLR